MVTSLFCEQIVTWPTTLAASRHCEATGKADMTFRGANVCFDPKRISDACWYDAGC
jgi:hypothetical protein